jgi:hypothetical protein
MDPKAGIDVVFVEVAVTDSAATTCVRIDINSWRSAWSVAVQDARDGARSDDSSNSPNEASAESSRTELILLIAGLYRLNQSFETCAKERLSPIARTCR